MSNNFTVPVSVEIARGDLVVIRDAEGRVVGAKLGNKVLDGFRSVEQRLVSNTKQGTFLAVTLSLECDTVSFVDLPPPTLPEEESGESGGSEEDDETSEEP